MKPTRHTDATVLGLLSRSCDEFTAFASCDIWLHPDA